jgi:hypothetical protein
VLDEMERSPSPSVPNDPVARVPRSTLPPPVDLDADDTYGDLDLFFARTPYENAPREVQEEAVRRAQTSLRRRGYYITAVDGDPGPETRAAIENFQRDYRLRESGRLDTDTLLELNLMPRERVNPYRGSPYGAPYRGEPIYRGRQVY